MPDPHRARCRWWNTHAIAPQWSALLARGLISERARYLQNFEQAQSDGHQHYDCT
jgi:hypothetical protein